MINNTITKIREKTTNATQDQDELRKVKVNNNRKQNEKTILNK